MTAENSSDREALRQFVMKREIISAARYNGLEHGLYGVFKQIEPSIYLSLPPISASTPSGL
jgi:hypothetical protein